jgi:hypothetical protein
VLGDGKALAGNGGVAPGFMNGCVCLTITNSAGGPGENRSRRIGHINLGTKQTGAPSAGNLHDGCDVAGTGNGFTVGLVRHSQRKRGETDRLGLQNCAPVLDPTGKCLRMRPLHLPDKPPSRTNDSENLLRLVDPNVGE